MLYYWISILVGSILMFSLGFYHENSNSRKGI